MIENVRRRLIDPPWLEQALLHIEKNIHRPIPAPEVFALSRRSSTFVENVFKTKLGLPAQAYRVQIPCVT